jgi:hypothetical protein
MSTFTTPSQGQTLETDHEIYFKNAESVQTAQGLKAIDQTKKSAIIPKGAEITFNRRNISVRHDGKNFYWSRDSVQSVINKETRTEVW